MGLDMFVFKTKRNVPPSFKYSPNDKEELFYWRKHPSLHGWMYALWVQKLKHIPYTLTPEMFNVIGMRLDEADLDSLQKDIEDKKLPETKGFFFGGTKDGPEQVENDLEFISKARAAIKDGYKVFYTSWW